MLYIRLIVGCGLFVWNHGKYHVDCGAAVHLNGGDA